MDLCKVGFYQFDIGIHPVVHLDDPFHLVLQRCALCICIQPGTDVLQQFIFFFYLQYARQQFFLQTFLPLLQQFLFSLETCCFLRT